MFQVVITGLKCSVEGLSLEHYKHFIGIRTERTGRTINGKPEILKHQIQLFELSEDGTMETFTGLLPSFIKSVGLGNVQITDHRPVINDEDRLDDLDVAWRPGQKEIIKALITNYQGRCRSPTGSGKTFILQQICKLYPDKVILIVTNRKLVLKEIKDRLLTVYKADKLCMVDGSHIFKPGYRAYLCSAFSLHKLPADWEPDILIYDEAHGAAGPSVFEQMQRFEKCRMYGLTATDEGRCDKFDKGIVALFGDRIIDYNYEDGVNFGLVVPVVVYMVSAAGPPFITTAYEDVVQKQGIIYNPVRNTRIAEASCQLEQAGITKELITVCTVEHALVLKRYRPGTALLYSTVPDARWLELKKKGLVSDTDIQNLNTKAIMKDFKEGRINRLISTLAIREGVDKEDLQCVNRADALTGSIPLQQLSGRGSRIFNGKTCNIVIDYTDEFGPSLKGRAMSRMKTYRSLGWDVKFWSST